MVKSADVFISGGGPAGLVAAIALRRAGIDVTVADAGVPPIDKACGEGLMPDAVAALSELDVYIPSEHSRPFRGIRFIDSTRTVAADFPAGPGLGIRRTALHRILVDHAASGGVRLLWNTPVDPTRLPAARWRVGADGGASALRRHVGLDRPPARRRFGFRRHYRIAPWSEHVEVYWQSGFHIYVTPVGPECVGIAVISDDPALRIDIALSRTSALTSRLAGAPAVSTDRGALTASLRLPAVARGNLALIGDAAGSVDAITGEGLSLAFRTAPALARAIATDDLESYNAEHARITARPAAMSKLLLTLGDHPRLRHAAFAGLSAFPRVFPALLAFHIGSHESNHTLPVSDPGLLPADHAHPRPGSDPRPLHAE